MSHRISQHVANDRGGIMVEFRANSSVVDTPLPKRSGVPAFSSLERYESLEARAYIERALAIQSGHQQMRVVGHDDAAP